MAGEIDIHGTLRNLTNKPDIAYEFQEDGTPWPSLVAAHAGCPEAYRCIGKKRYILLSGVLKEYWYAGGVAIGNLVPRYEGQENAENKLDYYLKDTKANTDVFMDTRSRPCIVTILNDETQGGARATYFYDGVSLQEFLLL